MSTRSTRPVYTTFDPERGPAGYTATNLTAFINQAGLAEELKQALLDARAANQAEYSRLLGGTSPAASTFWSEVARSAATRSLYLADQQQARFDLLDEYVANLPAGETLSLPSVAAASSTARFIDGARLQNIYSTGGQAELVRTLRETPVDRLRITGLEQMAKNLGVPAASTARVADKGDDRRRGLVNAILVHLGETAEYQNVPEGTGRASSSRSPRRAAAPALSREQALTTLERAKVTDSLHLLNLSVPDLNRLARDLGLIPGKNKAITIERIGELAGFEPLPTVAEVTNRLNTILNTENIAAAEAAAQAMREEELNMLSSAQLNSLYKHLQLGTRYPNAFPSSRSRPSKGSIIAHLTRNQASDGPDAVSSRRELGNIRRDYNTCVNADVVHVRDVADSLRISYNQFTTKEQLCADIYAYHLGRVSDILVSNLANLEAIAAEPETAPGRLAVIARNVNLDVKPNTVEELLQHWIPSHYGSRVIRLAPGQNAMLTAYIRNGTIPANVRQQYALARIFADIRPDLEQLEDDQLAEALQDLYDRFIVQAMAGDLATITNRVSTARPRNAYASPRRNASNGSPRASPRRNASPVQRVSPRRNASPTQASPRVNGSPRLSPRRNGPQRLSASPVQASPRANGPQRNASPRMSQLTQSPRRNASNAQSGAQAAISSLSRSASPRRGARPQIPDDVEEFDGTMF